MLLRLPPKVVIRTVCAAVMTAAGLTVPAAGQAVVRVLVTELESSPTILPTNPPTAVEALLQSKLGISPNGQYWICEVFNGDSSMGISSDAVIWGNRTGVLRGISRNQVLPGLNLSFEGAPWGFDARQLISNTGDVSISGSLNGANTNDECIIRYSAATDTFSITAREGDLIGGLSDERFGSDFEQRTFLSDGRVAFSSISTSGSLPAFQDDFVFLSGATPQIVAQAGSFPPGQAGVPPLDVNALATQFATNATGTRHIAIGLLNRTADRKVVLVDGTVVLEQGQPLPGPAGPFSTAVNIDDVTMGPGGHWAAWGRGASTGSPWLVANGQRIFVAGEDFPGGLPGEVVSGIGSVNFTTRGDLCFMVQTSLGGNARSTTVVIPVNGAPFVALTNGDLVDLNNNGDPLDDGVQVVFQFSAALADDGTLYVISRNFGPPSPFNFDVIGWVDTPLDLGCRADINGSGTLDPQDIFEFLNAWFGGLSVSDYDGVGGITPQDIFNFLNDWFSGCS